MAILLVTSPGAQPQLALYFRRNRLSRFCRTAPAWCVLVGLLMLGIGVATGCTARQSEAELASDALDRGREAHSAGRLDEAAADYREVLVHDAQNKFGFYNLGLIDQTSGRVDLAQANYRRALSIDPDFTPALFNLAILRENSGAHLEAIDLYRHVIAVDPSNAEAHLNLAFALRAIGQQEESQAELNRAVELNPNVGSPTPPP